MKKLLILSTAILFSFGILSCNNQLSQTVVNGEANIVMLVVPEELSSIGDDEQYGNFEIDVPEITQEVYDNSSISAYIRRTYDDGRPERWSQLPQPFLSLDNSSASYLSFGVGFIRISLQSEGSILELFDMMKGNDLKLVIN
ncbi:MAG: hypothetical protein ACJ0OQ_03610 [Candidatus Marisimplicoccus sp.]